MLLSPPQHTHTHTFWPLPFWPLQVKPEDMSPDPQCVKDYVEDPLNTVGGLEWAGGRMGVGVQPGARVCIGCM